MIDTNSDALGEKDKGDLPIIEFLESEKVVQGWCNIGEEDRIMLRRIG